MFAILIQNAVGGSGTVEGTYGSAAAAYAARDKIVAALHSAITSSDGTIAIQIDTNIDVVNTVGVVAQGDTVQTTGPLYAAVARPA